MLIQMVWNIGSLMWCIQHTLISPENWWFPYWSASSCCYVCGGHSQLSSSKAKILAYLDVRRVTAYLTYLGHNNSLTLKQLSRKRVMLFALTCPEISSSLTRFFYIAVQCVVPPPQLLSMATFFLWRWLWKWWIGQLLLPSRNSTTTQCLVLITARLFSSLHNCLQGFPVPLLEVFCPQ